MTKRDTNLRDRLLAECHGCDGGIAVRALSEAIMIIIMNAAPNVERAVADVDGLACWMRLSITEGFDQFLAMRQSITSSARARIDGEISRPSAFATIRLMTSSNLVGCSTSLAAEREDQPAWLP